VVQEAFSTPKHTYLQKRRLSPPFYDKADLSPSSGCDGRSPSFGYPFFLSIALDNGVLIFLFFLAFHGKERLPFLFPHRPFSDLISCTSPPFLR